MVRKLLALLLGITLGVFNRSSESLKITENLESSGTDDWLSKVIKEAENRPKRDDFYDTLEDIKVEIPPEFRNIVPEKFEEDHFTGFRHTTIIRTWTTNMDRDNVKQCLGVVVHRQTIVTPCSCVSYTNERGKPAKKRVTAFEHRVPRSQVTPIHGSEVFMVALYTPKRAVRGDTTVLHPRCDNQYEVDIAAVLTVTEIPDVKLVWVHTAENMLFENNMVRALAAQAVTGKCSVPVVTRVNPKYTHTGDKFTMESFPIFYQHWSGCLQNVCPKRADENYNPRYNDARCSNKMNGTRFCIGWKGPYALCNLLPGTPVFCDVGEVSGFMGFIVNQTYICPKYQQNNAVLQGFNDAINWIRYILEMGVYPDYENMIADWVKNFRSYEYIPKAKVVDRKQSGKVRFQSIFDFDQFQGAAAEAIVIVYWKKVEKCYGTLIARHFAVVPASCITERIVDYTNVEWYERVVNLQLLAREKFVVLGLANYMSRLKRRYVKVKDTQLHRQANSHYEFDYGLIQLAEEVANWRLAWVNTVDKRTFTKVLLNLPTADLVYGNCYYVRGEYVYHTGTGAPLIEPRTRRIRFENWNSCLDIVCAESLREDPENSESFQRKLMDGRCLTSVSGDAKKTDMPTGTRFCVSADPYDGQIASPLCSVTSGTPIFCDVEEARGFIGFISRTWTECPEHKNASLIEKDRAVFFGLNQFIDHIKAYTLLWDLKDLVVDKRNVYDLSKRSATPPLSQMSLKLLLSMFLLTTIRRFDLVILLF